MIKPEVINVSPEFAKKLLDTRPNRSISKKKVDAWAYEMENGNWQLNGETIAIYEDGTLANGQHRLSAIIKTGLTLPMLVVFGVKQDVNIYDVGRPRSTSDVLKFGGMDKKLADKSLVALTKLHYEYQTGNTNVPISKIKDFLELEKDTLLFVKQVSNIGHRKGIRITASMLLAAYYALKNGESFDDIEKFFKCLSNGFYEGKEETSAIVLRNDVIEKRVDSKLTKDRITLIFATERAIYDFCHRIPRKKTYSTISEPTYSKKEE